MLAVLLAIVIYETEVEPLRDKHAERILRELCSKAGITEPIRMYRAKKTNQIAFATLYHDPYDHTAIVFSEGVLARGYGLAFRSVLGHELGHVVHKHLLTWDDMNGLEQARAQHEADAFSIKIAGRDATYVYLVGSKTPPDLALAYIEYIDRALNEKTIEYNLAEIPHLHRHTPPSS